MFSLKKSFQDQVYYKKLAAQVPSLLEEDEKLLFGDSSIVCGEPVGATGATGLGYYLALTTKRIILQKVILPGASSNYATVCINYSDILRVSRESYKVLIVLKNGMIMRIWSLDRSGSNADNIARLLQAGM